MMGNKIDLNKFRREPATAYAQCQTLVNEEVSTIFAYWVARQILELKASKAWNLFVIPSWTGEISGYKKNNDNVHWQFGAVLCQDGS